MTYLQSAARDLIIAKKEKEKDKEKDDEGDTKNDADDDTDAEKEVEKEEEEEEEEVEAAFENGVEGELQHVLSSSIHLISIDCIVVCNHLSTVCRYWCVSILFVCVCEIFKGI